MNKLPISFDGVYYRSGDCTFCALCRTPLRYEWIIHENETGTRIPLCEKHYKYWENKRDNALMAVSDTFRHELQRVKTNDKHRI